MVLRARPGRDEDELRGSRWVAHRPAGLFTHRILLSAHNTHVSYDSFDERYPKTQGAFLRD
ncbi:erythromycin esterase family protein, partial [Streptomyces umbrinus]